jgi:catechol 2,3-dioxygenase-like lactoylglutathione lyase family enzyme
MDPASRPRLVGVNHVAIEVGDLDEALRFYGGLFAFELRGRVEGMAFLDMGDQFLALSETDDAGDGEDADRHFGLVVDDKVTARAALEAAGVDVIPGGGLDFRDPWGTRIQLVDYRDIQFTKTPSALAKLGLAGLTKTDQAQTEIREKGLG